MESVCPMKSQYGQYIVRRRSYEIRKRESIGEFRLSEHLEGSSMPRSRPVLPYILFKDATQLQE
jgi:hypothetical protein